MVFGVIITGVMFLTVNSTVAKTAYPEKTITIVCGWKAGGGSDTWARVTAKALEKYLPASITVVNKPGAGAQLAVQHVINIAPPDGYTIAHVEAAIAQNHARGMKGVDMRTDVLMLGSMLYEGYFLGARSDSKYKTFQDFYDDCKARPGKVKVATASLAGGYSIICHLLKDAANLDFEVLPFGSTAPAWQTLLAGKIDLAVAQYGQWEPYMGEGVKKNLRLHLIALAGKKRFPVAQDIPTFRELGYDVAWGTFHGLAIRKDTPKHIVDTLLSAFYKTAHDPEYRKALDKVGRQGMAYKTPEETLKLTNSYWDRTLKLKQAGLLD